MMKNILFVNSISNILDISLLDINLDDYNKNIYSKFDLSMTTTESIYNWNVPIKASTPTRMPYTHASANFFANAAKDLGKNFTYLNLDLSAMKKTNFRIISPKYHPKFFYYKHEMDNDSLFNILYEQLEQEIESGKIDTILFSTYYDYSYIPLFPRIFTLYQLCKKIRERYSELSIFVGGPYYRLQNYTRFIMAKKFKELNVYFANYTDPKEFLIDIEDEKYDKNKLWLSGKNILSTEFPKFSLFHIEADSQKMNAIDILKIYNIKLDSPEKIKNYNITRLEHRFNDGCPNHCAFCSHQDLKKFSFDTLKKNFESFLDVGYNTFFLLDSAINNDLKLIEKFCKWITDEKIDIRFSTSVRVKDLSEEHISMLFDAGLRIATIGCEATTDEALKYINKPGSISEYIEKIKLLDKYNIWTFANFIFGMPYFNENEDKLLKDFIDKCGGSKVLNHVYFGLFHLSPGSPFFNNPEKYGIKIFKNIFYNKFNHQKNLLGYPFFEMSRYHMSDFIEKRYECVKRIKELFLLGNFTRLPLDQTLLFVLYKYFDDDKSKIIELLNNNFETILNTQNAIFSE